MIINFITIFRDETNSFGRYLKVNHVLNKNATDERTSSSGNRLPTNPDLIFDR